MNDKSRGLVAGVAPHWHEDRLPDIALAAIRAGHKQIERVRIRRAVDSEAPTTLGAGDNAADQRWMSTLLMIERVILDSFAIRVEVPTSEP
jgi:hypothetical protein